jgi:type IV pilus assembly protein PilN
MLGVLIAVGAVAVFAMLLIYLLVLLRLNAVEDEIAGLDTQIAQQNARLAELAPYRDLQDRLQAKKPIADGIYRTRFPWDEFLQGLAYVVPNTTALDTLTAEASPIDVDAPVGQPLSPPGAVTFTGISFPQYANVADFVIQMNNLRFLANSQLNSAELDRDTFAEPAITFEVVSEMLTVAGENGAEVRLGPGTPSGGEENDEQVGIEQASGRRRP